MTKEEILSQYLNRAPFGSNLVGIEAAAQVWFDRPASKLNLAEAAYMLGVEETCRNYINKIRDRADVMMPHVTESGEALWDRLVNERRIEFAFETMRYFDLRRWKMADFYENIPFAGTQTMLLEKGGVTDTVYRMPRLYDPSKNDRIYYEEGAVYEYKWLGKTYKIDYGDCPLGMSPTQKYFPEDGRNYLMPIPRNEITKSKGTIEQNPGY